MWSRGDHHELAPELTLAAKEKNFPSLAGNGFKG
jgi:hypothetical protein